MKVKSEGKVIKIPKKALHGKSKFNLVRKYLKKEFGTSSFKVMKGK